MGFGKDELSKEIIKTLIGKNNMPKPAKVQEIVIEEFLIAKETKFIMVEVMNGYGKSLSFIIPSILSCVRGGENFKKYMDEITNEEKIILTPNVVIIADTNTLQDQLMKITMETIPEQYKTQITVDKLMIGKQMKAANILVCTPKMLDSAYTEYDSISFDKTTLIVFDEIESVNFKFKNEFKRLFELFNETRQIRIIGASATMNDRLRQYLSEFDWTNENNMQTLTIENAKMNGVTQYYYDFKGQDKFLYDKRQLDGEEISFKDDMDILFKIIYYINYGNVDRIGEKFNQIFIFFNNKETLRKYYEAFKNKILPQWSQQVENKTLPYALNPTWFSNDLFTSDRIRLLDGIQKGDFKVVFTTNLLSRGIDIRTVGFVINVGVPDYYEFEGETKSHLDLSTYQHRIARTGRFDSKGVALTIFINDRDKNIIKQLKKPPHQMVIKPLINLEELDKDITVAINHNCEKSSN